MELPKNWCQFSCLGPGNWWKILPMSLFGFTEMPKNLCQSSCLGPGNCSRKSAFLCGPMEILKDWHWCSCLGPGNWQKILLVSLFGPTEPSKKQCQCSHVSPGNYSRNSAHYFEWAHDTPHKMMPALLCGPRQLAKICYQCFCMGTWSCPKNSVGTLVSAHPTAKKFS